MSHSIALRPFGFSQPSRVDARIKRRADTPIPPEYSVYPPDDSSHHKSKSRRASLPGDSLGPYWAPPPSSQPRAAAVRSGLSQHRFPDEEEDDNMHPSRRRRTHDKRRPARLQTSRHTPSASISSPLTPTTIKMLANMQLRAPSSDRAATQEDYPRTQSLSPQEREYLEKQLKEVYSALRRAETDGQKVREKMEAGRADRHRIERELEETRRENRRLAASLEEMLRSPVMKSPSSARSDDAWGCSMYDMEAEGH